MKIKYLIHKHRTLISLVVIPLASLAFSHVALASSPIWTMTSYFGELDDVHHVPHNGVDFAMPVGTPVDSIVDGNVIDVRHAGNKSWGTSVHIRDTQGRDVIYGHLSEVEVQVGQEIHIGDEIALSGNTGHSTGAHLHIQININGKPIDPMPTILKAAIGRHE
jgi:murein DD-endopeptidase MepM/ murein hydrolase activator NlpD